jgi:recombinational DNA repair ATPase RecF
MSEMDSERRKLILDLIASYDQVLITVPDIKLLDNFKLDYSKLFSVNKGEVNNIENNEK